MEGFRGIKKVELYFDQQDNDRTFKIRISKCFYEHHGQYYLAYIRRIRLCTSVHGWWCRSLSHNCWYSLRHSMFQARRICFMAIWKRGSFHFDKRRMPCNTAECDLDCFWRLLAGDRSYFLGPFAVCYGYRNSVWKTAF